MRLFPARFARRALILLQIALALFVAAYLASFAAHAWMMLAYPYPLDYGEGPLLAQIEQLRAGIPIWQIYRDTAAAPYLVVNYPPLYLLIVAAGSWLVGSPLTVGRLLSLAATLGCVLALAALANNNQTPADNRRRRLFFVLPSSLFALIFLTIPIVREWGVLLRVDMFGICLGLWGLYQMRTAQQQFAAQSAKRIILHAFLCGLLFLFSLYTKPSLIAAPAAGCLWLAWYTLRGPQETRRAARIAALVVFATLGVGGVLLLGLLQWASDGWFLLHVVTANANRWEADLARLFWVEQIRLRWPLALAAALSIAYCMLRIAYRDQIDGRHNTQYAVAVLYLLFGIIGAVGVGKVGAYANYFLEFYAGLIWLICLTLSAEPRALKEPSFGLFLQRSSLLVLFFASLLYYPPLWDATRLRPAGLIEPSPPRLAFGRYGLWRDLRRERDVLAAQSRVQAALLADVRAAGPLIFSDMPGVAAAAGVTSRFQAFEQRQLFDQGQWDQRPLLLELANGELPLAVIDYLGNWLTPQMIELIQRRYAHDGSLGTFDRYRPVNPGPRNDANLPFPTGLRLSGYHLAPSPGAMPGAPYDAGELLIVTLEWQQEAGAIGDRQRAPAGAAPQTPASVVIQLVGEGGGVMLESERPLLYGALLPADWPRDRVVQHMQPLTLPPELPSGNYGLSLTLRAGGRDLELPRTLTQIAVGNQGGMWFEETSYFVPVPFRRATETLGGFERVGYPLTPAVPFAWGTLQCFERVCLELRNGAVAQRPLGDLLYLAETLRSDQCVAVGEWQLEIDAVRRQPPELCAAFRAFQQTYGEASLGPPISGEVSRYGFAVQWTRYARLERRPESGAMGLGRLGDDSLRLPPGARYRWP